ncbi:hypothetical protein SteCoe_36902 [Stentor coeruleus]|uniref:Uncharacterized protein n=1 Tax=Stentor coeruleus TaxID=5963 RepID=A0A1R2APD0_9CILI|nr:hypothetical protein SteCoe_36902 [Stentor coeruleus]
MHKSGVESLVLNWNKIAMEYLKDQKYQETFRLLKKSEELLKYPDGTFPTNLWAITNNNFGLYYKKQQKLSVALEYFFKALNVDIKTVYDKTNLAGTHLNICSVYSLMNHHSKALSHGILATKLLKKALEVDRSISTLTSLVIALNHTGFEYELLREYENARITYKCGLDLAKNNLGTDHPIALALNKAYKNLPVIKKNKGPIKRLLFTKNRASAALPKINSSSSRNRSIGTNSRVNSRENEVSGYRTSSNRTFAQKVPAKKQLPNVDRTITVSKRATQVIEDSRVQALEEKIADLQTQISLFQNRYNKLEKISQKPKLNKTSAAIIIQRFWRQKYPKNPHLLKSIFPTEPKIHKDNKKFEHLKMQNIKEIPINTHVKESKISNKDKEISIYPVKTKKEILSSKIQNSIKIPLDQIRESKIETKEMRAILIQSSIRGFIARKKYQRIRDAVIKIQKAYRKYQCSGLFREIRKAIVYIQRNWRKYRQNRFNKSIIKAQKK